MSESIKSVSDVVRYLKNKLDNDFAIQSILVEGEVSNLTKHSTGHWYFSLKDDKSKMNCVMFSSYNKRVNFIPKEGDLVLVRANTTVYESSGSLQLNCIDMKSSGVGDLLLQYELLKKKLAAEGLFDKDTKKPIPLYPSKIGIIVGAKTAAREDIVKTLQRRWPIATIFEYNSLVQGENAPSELIRALLRADYDNLDVLIIARGGGSIEDLWAFNDEALARVIHTLKTPIISGVGHEIDYTITDYVVDLRAVTPTAAAEHATPDINTIISTINTNKLMLERLINRKLESNIQKLDLLTSNLSNTKTMFKDKRNVISNNVTKMHHLLTNQINDYKYNVKNNKRLNFVYIENILNNAKQHYKKEVFGLDAYSPLKSLVRGYSLVLLDNNVVNSINQLSINDRINIRVTDGTLNCDVKEIKELK